MPCWHICSASGHRRSPRSWLTGTIPTQTQTCVEYECQRICEIKHSFSQSLDSLSMLVADPQPQVFHSFVHFPISPLHFVQSLQLIFPFVSFRLLSYTPVRLSTFECVLNFKPMALWPQHMRCWSLLEPWLFFKSPSPDVQVWYLRGVLKGNEISWSVKQCGCFTLK